MLKTREKNILFCDPKHINTREDGTQRVALDGFPFGVACVASYLIKNSKLPLVPHIAIFSNDIFNAINDVRAVPTSLVAALEAYIGAFNDLTVTIDGVDTITTEGTVPV